MLLMRVQENGGGSSPGKLKAKVSSSSTQIHPAITQESPHIYYSVYDEDLGSCEDSEEDCEEYDEYDELFDSSDTKSIASDDSFYPTDEELTDSECAQTPGTVSLFRACCSNSALTVKALIRQGVTEEEVRETDKNNRTGLMVACYHGYVEVVIALSVCPYLDVNWQDNEGNTALITAAQAGHSTITNYLLNYFPGLDMEKRNCHGFSALMKAAMQGRVDCVRALIMAGADLEARDNGRKLTPCEWALFTGRYETVSVMQRLIQRPCPEQCSDSYQPEWPLLPALVAKSQQRKGCIQKMLQKLRNFFDISNVTEASEDGVFDHMVQMTTALGSPFIATSCRTVCPGSPPCVGKRRYSVQEILKKQRLQQLKGLGPERLETFRRLFQNSRVTLLPKPKDRRASLQPQTPSDSSALRRGSLLPLHLVRRSSVRPGLVVPKLRITKVTTETHKPEKERRKSSCNNGQFLQVPKWRYKELKEERKKAEEAERKRLEAITRRHLAGRKQK
ncbi:ankyrin repeat domain-containing protein 33B [Tachysurus vachellii]|uniref:ankyrin repeat domain-containing protein 33B n=1 Tax=Tachysurus vachellii TaxID=175792 RepID=UPI00296AAAA0|nr:ankyrin repeat domain-containing protein 33B [Tachysurus vachellii]